MGYNFNEIEAKWQQYWKENKTFKTTNPTPPSSAGSKPPFYVLDMFPYPSGAGLHVGHPLGYIASDIITRYKRHQGFNVLHPMGYDSFGLPAEQYAIQTGQHPALTTEENINRYREQLDKIGFSFDWSREVRTSNPSYYRWTQWIFMQIFKSWYDKTADKARPISELIAIFEKEGNAQVNAACDQTAIFSAADWNSYNEKKQQEILLRYRLTYLAETEVNWCPGLGTVLANDEIVNGVSERGGFPVERKKMKQWSMRITAYAERLLNGLEQIDWTDSLKESQRNWIGKSKGTYIEFRLEDQMEEIPLDNEHNPASNHHNDNLYREAEEARRNPTKAESALWEYLKNRRLGQFFKQQVVLGEFIVDFLCPSRKISIDIEKSNPVQNDDYPQKRTRMLEDMGYQVLNFNERDIAQNIGKVLETLQNALKERASHVIRVFTTRPDTIFGVSFMVLAPEHDLVQKITTAEQRKEVERYIKDTAKRSEIDRMADTKSLTGAFTGAYAEHPLTQEPIPIWISDYVLAGYGTGAVMAVPAGDERDHRFAAHFKIPIPNIFEGMDVTKEAFSDKGDTKLINSDFLNGLAFQDAVKKINKVLEESGMGEVETNYRLRDAVFSRQRYWGEPFPVYYKDKIPYLIPEKCLPLKLPEVEKYLPTEEGNPPLGRARTWHWNEKTETVVHVENPTQLPENVYPLELNTMPGWAGSSWYFFRYMEDTKRDEVFASQETMDYWKYVNLYIGGSEHATGHLLYSRFWSKILKDLGYTKVEEPFRKLINQGMILGESAFIYRIDKNKYISAHQVKKEDEVQPLHVNVAFVNTSNELDLEKFKAWRPEFKNAEFITEEDGKFYVAREVEKMSKSKFNVVNPDDVCEQYGADSLRLYEMFLGPVDQAKPWSTAGLSGVHGFLKKLWRLYHTTDEKGTEKWKVTEEKAGKDSLKTLHHTIKKVTEDIESFSFNTAVSAFMIAVNELTDQNCHAREVLEPLAILVAPYAPHIAEELWEKLGHQDSVSKAPYPQYEEKFLIESSKTYPISFNGKKRFTLELPLDLTKEEIEEKVMHHERTQKQLNGRTPKRVIVVPGKIVNIVG